MPWKEQDPLGSGFKEAETSQESASKIEGRASALSDATLDYIIANPGRTADQIAEALNETPLAIRPRVSELRKAKLIVNDGRGVNVSGSSAHRWRAVVREVA